MLENANIIKYADDTVLYLADKNLETNRNELNKDIDSVANWLDEMELIINLKKGKAESLIFGTANRLSKQSDNCISKGEGGGGWGNRGGGRERQRLHERLIGF